MQANKHLHPMRKTALSPEMVRSGHPNLKREASSKAWVTYFPNCVEAASSKQAEQLIRFGQMPFCEGAHARAFCSR